MSLKIGTQELFFSTLIVTLFANNLLVVNDDYCDNINSYSTIMESQFYVQSIMGISKNDIVPVVSCRGSVILESGPHRSILESLKMSEILGIALAHKQAQCIRVLLLWLL